MPDEDDSRSAPSPGDTRDAREARRRAVDFIEKIAAVQNIKPSQVPERAEPITQYLLHGPSPSIATDAAAEAAAWDKVSKAYAILADLVGVAPAIVESRQLLAEALGEQLADDIGNGI